APEHSQRRMVHTDLMASTFEDTIPPDGRDFVTELLQFTRPSSEADVIEPWRLRALFAMKQVWTEARPSQVTYGSPWLVSQVMQMATSIVGSRLEVLLLKYLLEDGVNWEVVQEIEKATLGHQVTLCLTRLKECPSPSADDFGGNWYSLTGRYLEVSFQCGPSDLQLNPMYYLSRVIHTLSPIREGIGIRNTVPKKTPKWHRFGHACQWTVKAAHMQVKVTCTNVIPALRANLMTTTFPAVTRSQQQKTQHRAHRNSQDTDDINSYILSDIRVIIYRHELFPDDPELQGISSHKPQFPKRTRLPRRMETTPARDLYRLITGTMDHEEIKSNTLETAFVLSPPRLRQTVSKYLHFYLVRLKPYLLSPERIDRSPEIEKLIRMNETTMFCGYVGLRMIWTSNHNMSQRCGAGLMREEQYELIRTVYESTMTQMLVMMEYGVGEEEITDALGMTRVWLEKLSDPRFRSHRLEIMLLKYLKEDNVNWKVVEGVEMAQETHIFKLRCQLRGGRILTIPRFIDGDLHTMMLRGPFGY
ncbi:hypothetical protein BJ508DRAFT_315939, partial [Ascobolus immersus RN42]